MPFSSSGQELRRCDLRPATATSDQYFIDVKCRPSLFPLSCSTVKYLDKFTEFHRITEETQNIARNIEFRKEKKRGRRTTTSCPGRARDRGPGRRALCSCPARAQEGDSMCIQGGEYKYRFAGHFFCPTFFCLQFPQPRKRARALSGPEFTHPVLYLLRTKIKNKRKIFHAICKAESSSAN